jgi:hypothetical protein
MFEAIGLLMRREVGYQQGIELLSPQKRITVSGPILLSADTASPGQLFQAILVREVSKAGIFGSAEIGLYFYKPSSGREGSKKRIRIA